MGVMRQMMLDWRNAFCVVGGGRGGNVHVQGVSACVLHSMLRIKLESSSRSSERRQKDARSAKSGPIEKG